MAIDEPSTSASMLRRAQDGDAESWQQIAQVYGPLVYGWARKCGCQSADAADVMQEALSSVSVALARFDHSRDGATFRGWLWTITRNKIRDHMGLAGGDAGIGGTAAHLAFQQLAAPEAVGAEPPTDGAADAAAVRRRFVELLRADFDPRTWRMFWETTVVGRSPGQVAEEMGVSKWAVYKARARILQRLRTEMAGLD